MPCNTRGGDLATVEPLAWWPIRGFPCHPLGDIMWGRERAGRRHEDPGGFFWSRSGSLPARRLDFPTTCCLVLNKCRHVVWRHPTPRINGLLTRGCSQHLILDPPCAPLTSLFPSLFATYHATLGHCCSCHVKRTTNGLINGRAW